MSEAGNEASICELKWTPIAKMAIRVWNPTPECYAFTFHEAAQILRAIISCHPIASGHEERHIHIIPLLVRHQATAQMFIR
jgi:hypothetical protein